MKEPSPVEKPNFEVEKRGDRLRLGVVFGVCKEVSYAKIQQIQLVDALVLLPLSPPYFSLDRSVASLQGMQKSMSPGRVHKSMILFRRRL